MKNKRNKSNIIYIILLVIFCAVFAFSAFMIWKNVHEANKSAKSFDKIKDLVSTPAPQIKEEEPEADPNSPAGVYGDVAAQNSDFVGWIKIDDTKIDYPVVQTPDDYEYYLRRGFDKNYSYYGVPFAAGYCDVNKSANVIIYGHNMNNGSMFSDLDKYTSKAFYDTHKIIRFDTLESFGEYEVIAVFKTAVYADDEFKYYKFKDGTEQEFNEYVNTCKKLSFYKTDSTAEYGDRLLTLSTCEYSKKHGRLVVVAKRVK